MLVRTLAPDDAAAFKAVRLRGLRENPSAFAASHDEEESTPIETFAQMLAATPLGAVIGAFEATMLLGVVGIRREEMRKLAHKANVWGVYVVPEAQGKGVASRLLRSALDYAVATLHVQQVNLGVNTENQAALALYRKLGFVEYGRERGYLMLDGVLHDDYQMVCDLRKAPWTETL